MTIALTSAELVAIQDTIEQLLPDTCAILTGTLTSDGMGGQSTVWGTTVASIACRLDLLRGTENMVAGAIQPFTRWVLTMPHDATILPAQRVVHNSITYNVVSGVNADASWQASKRCIVEKVR